MITGDRGKRQRISQLNDEIGDLQAMKVLTTPMALIVSVLIHKLNPRLILRIKLQPGSRITTLSNKESK